MGMIPESFLEPLQWFSEYLTEQLKPDQPSDEQLVHKGFFLFRQGSVTRIKVGKRKCCDWGGSRCDTCEGKFGFEPSLFK